jgi:hypothetical protein
MESNEERQTYHLIVIGDEEKARLVASLKKIEPREATVVSRGFSSSANEYDFILNLTKEELSYIKLSCSVVKTVVVDEWRNQQDSVNFVSGILARM